MTTLTLDHRNPILRDAYVAAHTAMQSPAASAKLQAESRAIFIKLQGNPRTMIGKFITLGRLIDLFGEACLPAIAMAERMDFIRLQPCHKRFLVCRPYWYFQAVKEAAAVVQHPHRSLEWIDGTEHFADIAMAVSVASEARQ